MSGKLRNCLTQSEQVGPVVGAGLVSPGAAKAASFSQVFKKGGWLFKKQGFESHPENAILKK